MNHLPTAPFILKKFDIVNCSLRDTPLILIVSSTENQLFYHSHLTLAVPVFPYSTFPFDINPTFKKTGVFIRGGLGTEYQLEQDMWVATNLLRAVTKNRIVGRERVTRLQPELGEQIMRLIGDQLGL